MIYGGKEIDLKGNTTIKDILNNIDNSKHYFYIIQLPRCGSSRIKIGKSEILHKRFSEYANLFYGSAIYVLRLIAFPKKHYTGEDKTKYPNALFETMMKQKLKKVQGKTNVLGSEIQTEWYDYSHKKDVLSMFDMLKNESAKEKEHTKRTSDRKKIGDVIQVEWELKNSRKTEWYDAKVLKISNNTYTVRYEDDNSVMTHSNNTPWRFVEVN
tara:strand:+ start:455 stop:1090 length:636 start_codon:yes stop_codon:yes gene_type:complete